MPDLGGIREVLLTMIVSRIKSFRKGEISKVRGPTQDLGRDHTFFNFSPGDLEPTYWINIGGMAISTLAGSLLIPSPHVLTR
ncbi:MAG TPA: hypothetical protein VLG74_09340 [Blastocatellia bacterium]|nr:hypothetical protein [Blastocatellia bacterium]